MTNYESDRVFRELTDPIDDELTQSVKPIVLSDFMPILPTSPEDHDDHSLPLGHIAFMGDFVKKPEDQ